METSIVLSHAFSAAIFGYLMDWLQKTKSVPWVTRDTGKINAILRVILSGLATFGIHWQWGGDWTTGRTLLITIPALTVLGHALFNWAGQYAFQGMTEKALDIGRTWRIDPKVFDDLVNAIVARLQQPSSVPPAP